MNILEIKELKIQYQSDNSPVHAVNGVNLTLEKGECLGLVGETGAGKTTTALGIMGLLPVPQGKVTAGNIIYDGKELLTQSPGEMRKIRGKQISMIFQDPMTSLNPIMTVGNQISEMVRLHEQCSRIEADRKAVDMLEMVGIPGERFSDYPHQFSGGMKQRVIIAIALAVGPNLIIADEPTTALDVTIQAQVLELMKRLKADLKTSMIMITHDLGVVAEMCDKVAIMYCGEIVEYGSLREIYKQPSHPYTIGLFGSIPDLEKEVTRLIPIQGMVPDPSNLPVGCKFCDRCTFAQAICKEQEPQDIALGGTHRVKCHFPQEVQQ